MSSTVWGAGLNRLLHERRINKGRLAELAHVQPSLVSRVLGGNKPPQVATLIKLAEGFTAFDRLSNPHAPVVETWEFLVSDEQSAVLRARANDERLMSDRDSLKAKLRAEILQELTSVVDRKLEAVAPTPAPKRKHG